MTADTFPVTPGAAFSSGSGFLAKVNASGSQLEYATAIPGTTPASIVVDNQGNLYFAGIGVSSFPATPGAYQSQYPVIANTYVDDRTVAGRLNSTGSTLLWGTYISDSLGPSDGAAIAVDASGNVLVAGTDYGADGNIGELSAFLSKLSPDGSTLLSTTVFGSASVSGMKLSASGDIYIGVGAAVQNFPVTAPGFGVPVPPPVMDVFPNFLLHVAADGQTLVSSIYLPFFLPQQAGVGLDVDAAGNVYVTGTLYTPGTLTAGPGAFESAASGSDLVVTKITPADEIVGITYLGGSADDYAIALAAEQDGSVVVAGITSAPASLGLPSSLSATFVANFFPAITIENAASYVANSLVPGELVAIQGYGIGPAQGVPSPAATNVGGVQVYFGETAAPISYAQSNQINVQTPWELAGGSSTTITILSNGAQAGSATVPIVPALPGVFDIVNANGSINSPSSPARGGDVVSIFGTGGGMINPPGITGMSWPFPPLSFLTLPVSVTVGGEATTILYAGSAPTLDSGYFQINLQLPSALASGTQILSVTIDGVSSAPVAVTIQ